MKENLTQKTLNFITNVINNCNSIKLSFYNDVLCSLCDVYKNHLANINSAIYFLEDDKFELKAALSREKNAFDKEIYNKFDDFIKNNEDAAVYNYGKNNYLLAKLKINNSVFGIIFISSQDNFSIEIKQSFQAIVSIISYKIKDYELSLVYKMQLNALQAAIQEKEAANQIIKKQHKKLEKLDKAKNLFLANISHELRTPLNAIIGFSQALDAKIFGDLNPKQAEYVKDIQISGLHLLGMINEILDISKLEANAMKFTPCEISASRSIQEVVNILEPLYKNKNIEVIYDSSINIQIMADNQKFQQILYNLLSNSIKFTPNGGKITILHKKCAKNYFLEIKDTGIGIDKKYHNKIFKKYVHLTNSALGSQNSTGLGLTITKELVKLHKGKITLVSEPNKGASFLMEFKNIAL